MECLRGAAFVLGSLKVLILSFRHGFGNWVDIADFIGNNKSPEEVEEHYQQVYIKTSSFLPVNQLISRTTPF